MRISQAICPNCFHSPFEGSCRFCGYRQEKYSDRALAPGTVLNRRYVTGRLAGEGGFGLTYKAYDTAQSKICAIKEFAPYPVTLRAEDGLSLTTASPVKKDEVFHWFKDFHMECALLKRLENIEGIVCFQNCFEENGTAYLVMEFLEGESLGQLAKHSEGPPAPEEIAERIGQAAMAAARMHQAGILHLDLNPGNIFCLPDGSIRLIDFGSAREIGFARANGGATALNPLTAAPEQYSPDLPWGCCTDIYILAASCYYVLTGARLPEGKDRLMGAGYTPLVQLRPEIPRFLSETLDAALQVSLSERTQTMEAFAAPLIRFARQNRVPVLTVLCGSMAGFSWELPSGREVKIGKLTKECDILLAQDYVRVSRKHCSVCADPVQGLFTVIDLGSSNGTWVHGLRLTSWSKPARLNGPCNIILAAEDECILRLEWRKKY